MTTHATRLITALTACSLSLGLASGCGSSNPKQDTASPAEQTQQKDAAEANDTEDASKDDASTTESETKEKKSSKKKRKKKASEKTSYDKEKATQLQNQIQEKVDASKLHASVAIIDLTDGMPVSCNGDEKTTSASMIKMIIAHAFLKQVEAGAYGLDDTYILHGSDIVGGTGSLQGRGEGTVVTYRELVQRMISESDNTATNVLIRTIGMDAINADAKGLELTATQVNRLMMDSDAIAQGIENKVSANDLAKLFRMVYDKTFVNKEMSELVLEALKNQEDLGGISQGLPDSVVFAHKTGSLDGARHDGGIVLGDHPFVVVVLCTVDGYIIEDEAHALMQDITHTAYDALSTATQ